ncbi:hypothetical protein CR513_09028, partial [Mucuna pruriens]
MEAEERHWLVEERFKETLKLAEQREEELHRQLAVVREMVEKPAGSSPARDLSAFWAQPFSEEIEQTIIPQNF